MLFIISNSILLILSILVTLIPNFLGILLFFLLSFVVALFFLTNVIVCIQEKFKDKKNNIGIIISLITIIFIVFGYDPLNDIVVEKHYKKQIEKKMEIWFPEGYEIHNKTKLKSDYFEDCNDIYNVTLKDNSGVVFHAAKCERSSGLPYTAYINDYEEYYIPYYLKEFNQTNNTNIQMDDKNNILYNENNKDDVNKLIDYILKKNTTASYIIKYKNETTGFEDDIRSWMLDNYSEDYRKVE